MADEEACYFGRTELRIRKCSECYAKVACAKAGKFEDAVAVKEMSVKARFFGESVQASEKVSSYK